MSEHTLEPWDGKEIPLTAAGLARAGLGIVFTNHPATRDEAEANARRIVACVNACAGIPTDVLEAAPQPPKLSDERIYQVWDEQAEKTIGKSHSEFLVSFVRAIERDILGENNDSN